ncbi:serine hydrolase family protein, partial [Candidatus Microgenomates bacterium]|nr:serine hydrolase family protein [Candidatus Microgenomates bacterium]
MTYQRKRVFIVHGWGGSPQEGWFPWLQTELEKRNFKVYIPPMPDSEHPRMNAWLETLKTAIKTSDEDTYLVGHSVGCITILRYLERLPQDQKIGGAILVGGFTDMGITVGEDEDIRELKSFFETKVDFEKIREHSSQFVAIHSNNDPYVDLH